MLLSVTKSYLNKYRARKKINENNKNHTGKNLFKDVIHPLSEQKEKKARMLCGSRNFLPCQLSQWGITLINK